MLLGLLWNERRRVFFSLLGDFLQPVYCLLGVEKRIYVGDAEDGNSTSVAVTAKMDSGNQQQGV